MKEVYTSIPEHTQSVIEQIDHEGVQHSLVQGLVRLEWIENHDDHHLDEFTPEFIGDSPRVQEQMHQVSELFHEASASIPYHIETWSRDSYIFQAAMNSAAQKAKTAQAAGDTSLSESLLTSGLIMDHIHAHYNSATPGTFTTTAVEHGLASEIVDTARNSRGLVLADERETDPYSIVSNGETEIVLASLTESIAGAANVLSVATGNLIEVDGIDITSAGEIDTVERAARLANLTNPELIAIAHSPDVIARPDLQESCIRTFVANLSNHEIPTRSDRPISDLLEKSFDLRPDIMRRGLTEEFADIRKLRSVQTKYRINNQSIPPLDTAIVELWAHGYEEVASKLLTVGPETTNISYGKEGVLTFPARYAHLSEDQRAAALEGIDAHVEQRRQSLLHQINETMAQVEAALPTEMPYVMKGLFNPDTVLQTADPEHYHALMSSNIEAISSLIDTNPDGAIAINSAIHTEGSPGLHVAEILTNPVTAGLLTGDKAPLFTEILRHSGVHVYQRLAHMFETEGFAELLSQDVVPNDRYAINILHTISSAHHVDAATYVSMFQDANMTEKISSAPASLRSQISMKAFQRITQYMDGPENVAFAYMAENLGSEDYLKFLEENKDEYWLQTFIDLTVDDAPERYQALIPALQSPVIEMWHGNQTLQKRLQGMLFNAPTERIPTVLHSLERMLNEPRELWKDLYVFSAEISGIDPGNETENAHIMQFFPIARVDLNTGDEFIDRVHDFEPRSFADMTLEQKKALVIDDIEAGEWLAQQTQLPLNLLNPNAKRQTYAYMLHETVHRTRDKEYKRAADNRNRTLAAQRPSPIQAGDFVHSTRADFIGSILQDGNMAGESRKMDSSIDSFPFNVDVSIVDQIQPTSNDTINTLISRSYGNLALVYARNDTSWMHNSTVTMQRNTGLQGLIYGGVPSTEISAIILRSNQESERNNTIRAVVENGFYIPVYDGDDTILLTPERYDELRTSYNLDVPVATTIDNSFKTDTQLGSNAGSEYYIPRSDGRSAGRSYIKFGGQRSLEGTDVNGVDHIWTEYLGDQLYRAYGLAVPNTAMVQIEGQIGKASEWLDADEGSLPQAQYTSLNDGFVMDAWLGNWDIVRNPENVLTVEGTLYRLDNGNALDIRAQGDRKPAQLWTETVAELELGEGVNELGNGMRHMYPGLTADSFTQQVDRLVTVFTDDVIDQYVDSIRRSREDREQLKSTLKARRNYITQNRVRITQELS